MIDQARFGNLFVELCLTSAGEPDGSCFVDQFLGFGRIVESDNVGLFRAKVKKYFYR